MGAQLSSQEYGQPESYDSAFHNFMSPPQDKFVDEFNAPASESKPPAKLVPVVDGYKWRKYGQKQVKGQKYPRNYYKCTFPECTVKKFVEYGEDGRERVTYKGDHTHDPSHVLKVNAQDQRSFKSAISETGLSMDFFSNPSQTLVEQIAKMVETSAVLVAAQDNEEQNKLLGIQPETPKEEPQKNTANPSHTGLQKLVVETSANVDHLDDGYTWRKYGQKVVKGSSYPRSYYRCTEENCPVKKQVELRDSTVVNIYEGTHNHLAPSNREGLDSKRKRKAKAPTPTTVRPSSVQKLESDQHFQTIQPHQLLQQSTPQQPEYLLETQPHPLQFDYNQE